MFILIKNALIIDQSSPFDHQLMDILISEGTITNINKDINFEADVIIQEEGLMVSPGWVDIFADYGEPGYEHKETITTGAKAAAAGGFTHVFLVPNTLPTIENKPTIKHILDAAMGSVVHLYPLGASTQGLLGKELAEMMEMKTAGAIAFTDGWKPIQNANLLLKILEYIKTFKGILVQIPIDNVIASGGLMNEGIISTQLGMPGIPDIAETLFITQQIELLRYTRSRLHITGISTTESIAIIKKAKDDGLDITCSVTPYHLLLTDESLKGYNSIYKVAPPLRTEKDRQALIQGIKDGVIDCFATHHHPQDWDAKTKEFEYAAEGMAIQESAFNVLWTALNVHISIEQLIALLTFHPKKIFGLEQDTIDIQNKANLTIFTTSGTTFLQKENIQSKSKNNPFIRKEMIGNVIGVVNNGKMILNK